jgi:hypothetical protein
MQSPPESTCAPAQSLDALDRIAIAYLTVPLVIFLAGWFKWWAALLLITCTVYAVRALFEALPTAERRLRVTTLQLAVAIVAGCGWTLLGGADHIAFANADWHVRDAVLHDLVSSPWPVGYGLLEGKESLLRAPIGFYLPAALVGKSLGLPAAHIAMGFWTALGAALFMLQVLSLTPPRIGVALTVTAVVILFSGLDIIGNLLNDGPRFRSDWNITTHLEWWAGKFQYSSMTTQLFWVPNHALGGWLAVGLLARNQRSDSLNSMLPAVVVALSLWSPLTALGLVPFVLLRVGADSVRAGSLSLFHPRLWAPAALVGFVISGYLLLDPSRIPKGLSLGERGGSPMMDLLQQAQFFLLEAGFIGAAILSIRRSTEIALALLILAFLPLIYLGPANDLVMRASIPSLAVLAIGGCIALVGGASDKSTARKKVVLVALLMIGAVTPIAEIARAIFLPAWPINMSATLIGANCGGFAPHYVARLGDETIGRLMRQAHRLPLGPQGAASCINPAVELMWNWSFFPRDDRRLTPVLGKSRNP